MPLPIFVLLAVLLFVLVLSALLGKLKGVLVVLFGILIPMALFLLSGLLLPDWKGACRCGWVSGFVIGKFALTPIVVFAMAALFHYELRLWAGRPARWVQWGLVSGAVTSTLCLMFEFVCLRGAAPITTLMLNCYLPVWYIWRAVRSEVEFPLVSLDYLCSTFGMIPFWIGSWFWSHRVFDELINTRNLERCFVVTAAARGHQALVGPFVEIERCDGRRKANLQLITFWRAEEVWRTNSPASHRFFWRVYNFVGPRFARRIRSPWVADLVFLSLKPVEWVTRIVLLRAN